MWTFLWLLSFDNINKWNLISYALAIGIILAISFRKKLHVAQYHLKFAYFLFVSYIISVVLIPVLLLRPRDVRNASLAYRALRFCTEVPLGIQCELRGEEHLKKNFPCVVISNHQSALDLIMQAYLSTRLSGFIGTAKQSLLFVFPFGPALWLCGTVFINRNKGPESRRRLKIAADRLHETMAALSLFPEGTRNKKPELLPFKKGAFEIAVNNNLPILPVVVSPYYFIDDVKKIFKSGKIIIQVLPPIETKPEDSLEKLAGHCRDVMNEDFKKLLQPHA